MDDSLAFMDVFLREDAPQLLDKVIADEAMKQLQPRTHESDGPIVVHEREQTKKMEEAAQAPIQETVQKETKTKACQSPIIIDEAFDDDKEILSSHKEIIVVGDQGWYSVMVPK